MQNAYYYEEVTRDGKQWWRMTPNGDWLEKRDTDNPVRTGGGTTMLPTVGQKYDRAAFAFGFAKTMLTNVTEFNESELNTIPIDAVKMANALIAELQRTEK